MPIYEYLCEACGAQLDIFQKLDEPAPPVCKNCEATNTLKKRISMSAFHLKGGGWHSELYASPSQPNKTPPNNTPQENKTETSTAATTTTAPSPCASCPAATSSLGCAASQKP